MKLESHVFDVHCLELRCQVECDLFMSFYLEAFKLVLSYYDYYYCYYYDYYNSTSVNHQHWNSFKSLLCKSFSFKYCF